jgi:uncharacterized Zn-finger protein
MSNNKYTEDMTGTGQNINPASTIIYTTQDRVGCSGENNDHPLVYYSVPEKGYVTCGYCDIKYAHREKEE